jgi:hypothetical protein
MTERRSIARWGIYVVPILILLVPLVWLSQPATIGARGDHGSRGGKLAQLRNQHHLSEANLGAINPTSETFKLATLGLRGVAVSILWTQANHYKKVEDWDHLTVTLEQMTLLQPHFVTVWRHQAWNLAFNVAAEFDDYRFRYYYAKKGITFLIDGTTYNQREPSIWWDVGRVVNQKIGRSDERVQFRRLFAVDKDFHRVLGVLDDGGAPINEVKGPDGNPDNWLVGREWYLKAERLVERDPNDNIDEGKMGPLLFYDQSAKCKISFAEAIEKDGHFGKDGRVALDAWKKAEAAWIEYGMREMPGRSRSGRVHRLAEYKKRPKQLLKLRQQLDALKPGLREKLREEKLATLEADWQAAYRVPREDRNPQQRDLAGRAARELATITDKIVADKITGENHEKALELAAEIRTEMLIIGDLLLSLNIVPYDAWLQRCIVEQSPHVLEGRQRLYLANQQYLKARLDSAPSTGAPSSNDNEQELGAKQQFELGFAAWARAFEEFPSLYEDRPICEDLAIVVVIYQQRILDRAELPEDFPLMKVLERYPPDGLRTRPKPEEKNPEDVKKDDEKKEDEKKEDEKKAKP